MDSFANGITLLGIPAVVLVPVIVEGLKKAGMPVSYSIFAAIGAAFLVAALAEALNIWPEAAPVVRVFTATIVVGFAAAGVYSQGKFWTKNR